MDRNPALDLKDISAAQRFALRFSCEDPVLESSLERKGVLFPLLFVKDGGPAEIVSGHKRLAWARKQGKESLPALPVKESFSPKELFFLALYSNWNQQFPELDRMAGLSKAKNEFHFSDHEILRDIMPVLGISSSAGILNQYLEAAKLGDAYHRLILKGRLPFRGVHSLSGLSQTEREFLGQHIFPFVHLTSNQVTQLTEWLEDLKKIKKQTLENFLSAPEIQKTVRTPHGDLRSRGEKFFEGVRGLRFPKLTKREKDFSKLKDRAGREGDISILKPQGPETEGILVETRLRNSGSIRRVLQFLQTHRAELESFL